MQTSGYRFGRRSSERLATCHPYLQTLMRAALESPDCPCDFSVIEGHRGEARQNEMHDTGASQLRWPKSRHNTTPSLAVDVAPYIAGAISWDWTHYHPLAAHIKATWARLVAEGDVAGELEWGGDWRRFKDGPHWQITGVRADVK